LDKYWMWKGSRIGWLSCAHVGRDDEMLGALSLMSQGEYVL
jgi:hypothetical protein